jgi:hypothetical protein
MEFQFMRCFPILAGATACALLAAAPASAAIMIATYVGSVSASTTYVDVFGTGLGAGLDGQTFTATFTYDTETGLDGSEPGYYEERDGGSAWGAPSPMLGANLTINSVTYDNFGGLNDVVWSTFGQSLHRAEGGQGGFNRLFIYLNHAAPGDLEAEVPTTDGSLGAGQFRMQDARGLLATGNLRVSTLTIAAAPTAVVPEPAGWALMILGFGAVGGMLRARRASGRPSPLSAAG